ncbi:MAG TPA: VCBS repeat-containing protein [Saprospiraceae bacterium]|nr:VCBS repeat-containing protein [Saprospiraceae bacterium]HMQ84188.1 VCBS repeat-containing protein [Saprospiraceae bacterium]
MNKAIFAYLSLAFSLLLGHSCQKGNEPTSNESTMLTLSAEQTGIDFVNQLVESLDLNIIEYLYYYNGGGVAIGDINNDGLEDIYFTANQGPDKLYLNKGQLQFEDITEKAGIIQDNTWSSGVVMEDLNNDGYLDIHVCKVGVGIMPSAHNLVYVNQKDGTFREMATDWGLDFQGYSTQACFLDYDKDGDLDMYLLNHNVHSINSYGTTKKRQETDPYAGDRFFENRVNEAEQAFVDVTQQSGIYSSPLGYGLAVSCADINGDGWTDLYIGNDFHENDFLYFNNGNKTFTDAIDNWTDHTTQFSMGADIADINNDLLPDVFSTDMLPFDESVYLKSGGEDTDQVRRIKADLGFEEQYARNHLQINTGFSSFTDIALQTRTFATDWSWAVLLQDFDNNGKKDIFITNGIAKRPNDLDYINYLNSETLAQHAEDDPERTRKLIEKLPIQKLRNVLFLQTGDLVFSDIAQSQVGAPSFSNGAAFADLDQDGYLEVVVNNIDEPAIILKYNTALSTGNYLSLELKDPSGKTAKGAKAYVYAGGQIQYQELQSVKGYQSSSSHRLHFGLGKTGKVDSLVVLWPDGGRQVETAISLNTHQQVVKKGSLPITSVVSASTPPNNFQVLPIPQEENAFNDDESEKLIPELLSREGPAVLYEDLDADGIKDLLLGGAHGHATRLLKGKSDGSFDFVDVADFTNDNRYEDVSAASIDFDGDGDRDLYIMSGGNVVKELDKLLEDRLYLNNGHMDFRRIPLSFPHTNGSVVKVADYDQDGYEDIFVGARSIPGSYGLSPYSFVLKNKAGTGVEIAYQHRFGMVTDAHWIDIDTDKDLDLVLCGDWMPVTVLENKGQGELAFLSESSKFPQLNGFWNKLAFADLNQDGKMDVLAGNLGTNDLLRASKDQPIRLYIGDFDDNGSSEPFVFFHYFNRYIPLGSRDKFLSQLPGLKKQFVSYESFSKVNSFETMLPPVAQERLVETKTIDELRSMLFLSEGDHYTAVALPEQLQTINIRDIYLDTATGVIYYLGGNQELVAVRGNSMTARMGKLADFDPGSRTFKTAQGIEFPRSLNARNLIALNNGKYLVITNSDYLYLIDMN